MSQDCPKFLGSPVTYGSQRVKDWISKALTFGFLYKFKCGLCNESYYSECVRHYAGRIGEHIGISPLAKKQVKQGQLRSQSFTILLCNHLTNKLYPPINIFY